MDKFEAEALAHIAALETGLDAQAQQLGPSWIVAINDQGALATIPDAHSYRIWRDDRLGQAPRPPAPPQSASGKILWLVRRAIWRAIRSPIRLLSKILPLKAADWRAEKNPQPSTDEMGYRRSEGEIPTEDFGYRRTHPPKNPL